MNVKINHRLGVENLDRFNEFDLTLKYDSVGSTFGFDFNFDPKNRVHAEMACVSHFHEAIVEHNGKVLVTGFVLSQVFNKSSEEKLVAAGGYSKAGVFEDCNYPRSLYPLQMNGLSLAQIAKKVCDPFKLKVIVDAEVASIVNKAIPKVTCEPTTLIKEFLTEHATQRDVVLTHNEKGDLVFTKAKTNLKPLFTIDDENPFPSTDISMSFSGQDIHSDITVIKQADSGGGNAGDYTIKNPYCPIVFRPKTIIQTSGDDISTAQAAKNALAAELKNIVLTVEIDRWDPNGSIILPNNIISVKSPKNYLYNYTNWFIESVNYHGNEKALKATLTCVLPEVYNKQTPKNIFVDTHKNFPRI